MAEEQDKESKTEEATPHKIEESIRKGNTPVSRDVAQFASILAIASAVPIVVHAYGNNLQATLMALIERPYTFRLDVGADALMLLTTVFAAAGLVILLPLGVLMAFGIMVSLLQNPLRFVGTRIKPEYSRISLSSGFTRIFGAQGRVEFMKGVLKLTVLSACALAFLIHYTTDLVNAILLEPTELPDALARQLLQVLLIIGTSLAAIVVFDVFWSRFKWRKDLRMSKQEIKDEHKQSEGDPMLRAKRLSLARDRARRRMLSAVPKATVVIANPTHYAVALRYVRGDHAAPVVVAKGLDNIALKIREIAEANDIPVIEDKALARSLHAAVVLDRPIPPEFYKAIAEIILFLMSRAAATSGPTVHLPRGA
jgi:flagellar biosynthetic protein FlhB